MGLITRRPSVPKEIDKSRLRMAAEKVHKFSKPAYDKASKVADEVARKEKRVVKYATSPAKGIKHNRRLPWRI